jgi:hypothetical protein
MRESSCHLNIFVFGLRHLRHPHLTNPPSSEVQGNANVPDAEGPETSILRQPLAAIRSNSWAMRVRDPSPKPSFPPLPPPSILNASSLNASSLLSSLSKFDLLAFVFGCIVQELITELKQDEFNLFSALTQEYLNAVYVHCVRY